MKIQIWSDIACPYCYIGKRKLEMALSQFSNNKNVELEWHSYELDPSLPKIPEHQTIYKHFSKGHGVSEAEAKAYLAKITDLAKEVGLNYDFDHLVVANTSDALRLVKLASESGLATEAEEVLFEAYFVKGVDVSDHKALVKLGTQIGLEEADILSLLSSDKYLADIKKDIERSENEYNLEYIPFYIFNNKQIVEGSIASEKYLEILNEAYKEWESGISSGNGGIVSGQSCSIDGVCS